MDARVCTHDLDFLLNGVVRATTDIRDENLRLKAENERLQTLLSEIMPELELLRKEGVALKAAVRVLVLQSGVLPQSNSQKRATFAMLPYEILQPIFNYAAAEPTYQFDPSIQPGSYSPWLQLMRMKKGFPLICRASFWPGMSVLYNDVVLRRMGQVSALAETLRASDVGPRLASLIKGIRWDSCIVAAPCADVIREDLTFIFGQCTQLQSFSYHPHHNFPLRCQPLDGDECEGFFNPLWFIMMPSSLSDSPLLQSGAVSNLRSLDMSAGLQLDDDAMLLAIHRILPTFKTLESLTLGPWSSSLSLPEEIMRMPGGLWIRTYVHAGTPPKLARLTVFLSTEWSPKRLLERFGNRLRYLHLYPTGRDTFFDHLTYIPTLEACSALSAVCPLLEHLVVPKLLNPPLLVNSPTLLHLDLWATPSDDGSKCRQDKHQAKSHRLWALDSTQSSVPSLRTVRYIIAGASPPLPPSRRSAEWDPDWPWVCHPRLLAEDSDEVLYHRFPLGRVAQTVAAVIPENFGQRSWEGGEFEAGEDWPGVYGDLDEMQRRMDEEREAGDRRLEEREARGEETSSSDWTSDDSDSEEEDDGNLHLNEHDAVIGENVEGTEGPKELQDEPMRHMDPPGEREQSQEREEKRGEEGDGRLSRRQLEAAAELVPAAEYPVAQLDRATILAAFRRGEGRAYNHVDLWDHY